jgi:endogenous inhibitor of DNA gyrase (YacG/DUF329 family)
MADTPCPTCEGLRAIGVRKHRWWRRAKWTTIPCPTCQIKQDQRSPA